MATKKKTEKPELVTVTLLPGFASAASAQLKILMTDERLTEDQRQVLNLLEGSVRSALVEYMRGPR